MAFSKFKEYIPFYQRNLRVAFPVMLTQLMASLAGFFDTMMVGHFSTTDLAAVSFANAIFFTVMVFAMGITMGITPLVGFEMGKKAVGDEEATKKIAAYLFNGTILTSIVALLMTALMGAVIPFMNHFGQDPAVVESAKPYYGLIVVSIIPFLLFFHQKQFLEGIGNTFYAMIISFIMNGLNIFLNWVFIFGHCGFEALGATGAGIATLISRLLMPFCFFAVIVLKKEWRRYVALFSKTLYSFKQIKELLKIGVPIGLQTFSETFLFTLSFIIVGWLNKESLAAQQIANQICDLTFMLALGIGSATTIRVSHQLGKGDLHAVRMASNASIHLCLLINTLGALVMFLFCNELPTFFSDDPEVIKIASTLIVMAGFFQYADGMQAVGSGMLRGIQDVTFLMIVSFVSYILIALPVGIVCMFVWQMGAIGMWVGFIVGLWLAAILFHLRFRKKFKQMMA